MNKKAKEYILLLLLLVVYIVLFPNDIFRCNMNSDQNENLLNEELNVICDGEESEGNNCHNVFVSCWNFYNQCVGWGFNVNHVTYSLAFYLLH